jgi:hypothetical protein
MIQSASFSPPFIPDDAPASGPIFTDLPNWQPDGSPKHHIYQQYFTHAERRMLDAVPPDDVTSEILLLRVLLARSFAQVPRTSAAKKRSPFTMKFNIDLLATFSRVGIVIGGLVALQNKLHNLKDTVGDIILQALREMDPDKDLC